MRVRVALWPALAWLCGVGGCGLFPERDAPAERFAQAQQKWLERDDFAYRAWLDIEPSSPQGRSARARLARADALYRTGLSAFRAGDSAQARESFIRAAEVAPIDPHHYLSLARTYAARGMLESAAKYYGKFLRATADSVERARAERELAALEVDPTQVLEPPRAPYASVETPRSSQTLPFQFTAILVLAALLVLWVGRRRSAHAPTLAWVIERHPELHPAIAYLVGSLRHELLKHRVAAVGQALVTAGNAPAALPVAQQAFVRTRLLGVDEAFREHMTAFARELGHRLVVTSDPLFKRGARAARAIEQALPTIADARGLTQIRAGHAALLQLDRELASLQKRLVRTRIDAELLRELVRKAYAEMDVRSAEIDDLECRADGLPVMVEVLRSDLLLVLRNLLRNAIFATARAEHPRLVRLEVKVELEPTGQEFVCIAVQDSSPEPLLPAQLAQSDLGSGLGLSVAAVRRYGGSLAVASAALPLRKQVCVRFVRIFDDTSIEDGA